jgi:hypothetical protein
MGPAAPEPVPLGQFLPSQIVKGALLTCISVQLTSTAAQCVGMKLNGLDIVSKTLLDPNVICAAVTGKTISSSGEASGTSDPHYIWNGSAWAPEAGALPNHMADLSCNL